MTPTKGIHGDERENVLVIGNQDRYGHMDMAILNLEEPEKPIGAEGYVDARESYDVSLLVLSKFTSTRAPTRTYFKLDQDRSACR